MLWMQTYLFYCSVRLGVIVIAFLTSVQLLVPAVLLLVFGIEIFKPAVELFENDDYYRKNVVVKKLLNWIDEYPENFIIIINVILFTQIATCILAMYGAFKLQKYLLLPLIVTDFFRVIICLAGHIVLMIVLKKLINLGVLVAFTLLGGFIILYMGYNWCACVALYQIINLIHCERYRALYGDDPFYPHIPAGPSYYNNPNSFRTIENVHVLTTPNGSDDIDAMKQRNYEAQQRALQNQGIIAVLPVNYQASHTPIFIGDSTRFKQRTRKWWQDTKSNEAAAAAAALPSTLNQKQHHSDNDYSVNYGNWQWSEIMVPGTKKRNVLLDSNYPVNDRY